MWQVVEDAGCGGNSHDCHSQSIKVLDFYTNCKSIYEFLLVIDRDLSAISHHFRDIYCASKIPMRLFVRNFAKCWPIFQNSFATGSARNLQQHQCNEL